MPSVSFTVRTIALVLVVLGVAGVGIAQTADDTGNRAADSGLVERVRVALVQIPFLARDRQGRPVADLTPSEIAIKLRRTRTDLAFLEQVHPDGDRRDLPRVRLHVEAPGGGNPDEGGESAAGSPHHYVLFIDVVHDTVPDRREVIRQVRRFVRELERGDRIAVMSYAGTLEIETPFTTNADRLVEAVENAYARPVLGGEVRLERRILDLIEAMETCSLSSRQRFEKRCVEEAAYAYAEESRPHREAYFDALDGIVRYLGGLNGRKSVLALSHGIAAKPDADVLGAARALFGGSIEVSRLALALTPHQRGRLAMERLMESAVAEGVTLHFIDPTQPGSEVSAARSRPFEPGEQPFRNTHVAEQGDLDAMASATGGLFVRSTDVYRGLSEVVALERGAYVVGFYVDRFLSPKELGKVSVSSTRKGVRISHRRGHYVRQSAEAPFDGQILAGTATASAGSVAGGRRVPFTLRADPEAIGYETTGDEARTTFTLHVWVSTDDGRSLTDSYHLIHHAYPRDRWEAGTVEPVTIRGWVELPPGSYGLHARIRNPLTGRQGRLETMLEVPEP